MIVVDGGLLPLTKRQGKVTVCFLPIVIRADRVHPQHHLFAVLVLQGATQTISIRPVYCQLQQKRTVWSCSSPLTSRNPPRTYRQNILKLGSMMASPSSPIPTDSLPNLQPRKTTTS